MSCQNRNNATTGFLYQTKDMLLFLVSMANNGSALNSNVIANALMGYVHPRYYYFSE
jgi:hypothetical protein